MARRWASACALALSLVMLLAATQPVAAADPITITARGLLGGRFTAGEWAAISVSLSNDGAPVTGALVADSDAGPVRRAVELPAGSRKEVVLYLRLAAFARDVTVTFEAPGVDLEATAEVAGLDLASTSIAIVGDDAGALRTQLAGRDDRMRFTSFSMPATDLPERPEPMRGLGAIVWAGDSSGLREGQLRTLERWVAAGGQLVVIGGADWQARTASLGSLLPVSGLATVDEVDPAPIGAVTGPLPDGVTALTVATGELTGQGRTLIPLAATDERPLVAGVARGAGRVIWVGADLAAPAFAAWEAGGALWSRIVPIDAGRLFSQGPGEMDVAAAMSQALANLPALEVPPAELLLIVIIGYILLIGPVSYVALRRVDRRELAWVTAPLLVLVFSSCSYGIGASMKGSSIIVNQIAVIQSVSDGSAASVSTWAGIFSPTRQTYDLSVAGDALLAPVSVNGELQTVALPTEQGDPAHLRGLAVNVFGLKTVRADALIDHEPSLRVDWQLTDGRLSGQVTNVSDAAVADVAVVTASAGEMVGSLAAGESRSFEMAVANSTGASPADQVYGFVSGAPGSDEARARAVRRQVIASLVGYGGDAPISAFSASPTRGPFVVGWHELGASLIEVDGQEVQRFSQSIEVVSGRPTVNPAAIELKPVDLATRVVATEGQVDRPDPWSLVIGEGSATFEMAVPLELAGLDPSEIVVWVASDPYGVYSEQNYGPDAFPSGFRAEIWDAATQAWEPLGDLSRNTRFVVDQADDKLSADGTLLVRLVGEGIDQDVGMYQAFAGASIAGALP